MRDRLKPQVIRTKLGKVKDRIGHVVSVSMLTVLAILPRLWSKLVMIRARIKPEANRLVHLIRAAAKQSRVLTRAGVLAPTIGRQIEVIPYLCVILALVLVRFWFTSDLQTFLVIISAAAVFMLAKFDGRILMGTGLIMLASSAIILAVYKNEGYANQIAFYFYWFLVGGVACQLVDYLRSRKY